MCCIRHPNIIGSHIISFSEVLIQRYLYISERRLFLLHLRTLRDHNSRSFGGDNLGLDEQQCMFDHIWATAEGEGRPFRWGLWNIGISSRLPFFCQTFQEEVGESLDEAFSHLPLWLKSHLPINLLPPHPTCTPPVHSPHLYLLPKPLFYICGFFRPAVGKSINEGIMSKLK